MLSSIRGSTWRIIFNKVLSGKKIFTLELTYSNFNGNRIFFIILPLLPASLSSSHSAIIYVPSPAFILNTYPLHCFIVSFIYPCIFISNRVFFKSVNEYWDEAIHQELKSKYRVTFKILGLRRHINDWELFRVLVIRFDASQETTGKKFLDCFFGRLRIVLKRWQTSLHL